jgi:hypothetical protein
MDNTRARIPAALRLIGDLAGVTAFRMLRRERRFNDDRIQPTSNALLPSPTVGRESRVRGDSLENRADSPLLVLQ